MRRPTRYVWHGVARYSTAFAGIFGASVVLDRADVVRHEWPGLVLFVATIVLAAYVPEKLWPRRPPADSWWRRYDADTWQGASR